MPRKRDGGAGSEAPLGQESSRFRRCRDAGCFVLLRLYGPLEPWFNKSWQPGDLVLTH